MAVDISIESRFLSIKKLIENIVRQSKNENIDQEILSYCKKMCIVQICGAIERSMEVMIVERIAGNKKNLYMKNYLKYKIFKKGTNFKPEIISSFLGDFNSEWKDKFNSFIVENPTLKGSVNSCYRQRNSISHGENSSDLRIDTIRQYYDDSFHMLEKIKTIISL